MSLQEAIAEAGSRRLTLLIAPEVTPEEVAVSAGKVPVLDPDALALEAWSSDRKLAVIRRSEVVVGVVNDTWCGPWTVLDWMERHPDVGLILHTSCADPDVIHRFEEAFEGLPIHGRETGDQATPAQEDAGPPPTVEEDDIRQAIQAAAEGTQESTAPRARLLMDLAHERCVQQVWRVPFLVRVVDERRFKRPFVEETLPIGRFFDAYEAFVGGLGLIESAAYQLGGRHPRDLRLFAVALEMSVLEVARIFRLMDMHKIVVSSTQEEGAGARPNLHVVAAAEEVEISNARNAVEGLRALRQRLALPPVGVHVVAQARAAEPMSDLFASLSGPAATVAAPEGPDGEGAVAESPPAPPVAAEPVVELPAHLPGLEELAAGRLTEARAKLGAVVGELAQEAQLLASFGYEFVDGAGRTERQFQIPGELQQIVVRTMELDLVPSNRFRVAMDDAFPGSFIERPRPGRVEVFYEAGPLTGTHRFVELRGRSRFEEGRLDGVRAAQSALESGQAVDAEPGADPGWVALAEALRARDAGDGVAAWQALQQVDLDLDLDGVREQIIPLLPEDHEIHVARRRQEEQRRVEEAFRPVARRLIAALDARGTDDDPGYEALELAESRGLNDTTEQFLGEQSDEYPRDPGPPLWMSRLHMRHGHFTKAEDWTRQACSRVGIEARKAEWWFDVVEAALRAGRLTRAWSALEAYLATDPDPRLVDDKLDKLFRAELLTVRDAGDLTEILTPRGANDAFPRTWEQFGRVDEMAN